MTAPSDRAPFAEGDRVAIHGHPFRDGELGTVITVWDLPEDPVVTYKVEFGPEGNQQVSIFWPHELEHVDVS